MSIRCAFDLLRSEWFRPLPLLLAGCLLACGGGGGGAAGGNVQPPPPPPPPPPITTTAPAAIYPVPYYFPGDPTRVSVPSARRLVTGGGKLWFLNNSYLQSFDPASSSFKFEADFQDGALLYEGNPWIVDIDGIPKSFTGGTIKTPITISGFGLSWTAASDNRGRIYIVFSGNLNAPGDAPVGPTLVQVDTSTLQTKAYPLRPWDGTLQSPEIPLVIDPQRNQAFLFNLGRKEITRVDLADGKILRFQDSRILWSSRLLLDGKGGVDFFQQEGLFNLSADGVFTFRKFPAGFSASCKAESWASGFVRDDKGRIWISGDYGRIACIPPEGEGKLYSFPLDSTGTSFMWYYAGQLAWNEDQLWMLSPEGGLFRLQIPSGTTLPTPDAPTLLTQPSSREVGQYLPTSFTVKATGTGTLTYQWCLDGKPIPWAWSATHSVDRVTGADVGNYTCIITHHLFGATAKATTAPARLSLIQDPAIPEFRAEPRWVRSGEPVSLLAHFTGGTGRIEPGGILVSPGIPVTVFPTSPTTYRLTVTNASGNSQTATVSAEVDAAQSAPYALSASPADLDFGGSSLLTWTLPPSLTALTLSDNLGLLVPLDVLGKSPWTVSPQRRQRFILSGLSASGEHTQLSVLTSARGLDRVGGQPGGLGELDGQGTEARMSHPGPMAVQPDGSLIFADSLEPVIRKLSPDGVVRTLSGRFGVRQDLDGPVADARFVQISGLAISADGTLFILDHGAGKLKKLTQSGEVKTVMPLGGGGQGAFLEQMTFDKAGNLVIPLYLENRIVSISPAGILKTIATGITYPTSVACGADGSLRAIGTWGITRVSPEGVATTTWPTVAAGDPAEKEHPSATGITADSTGTYHVSTNLGIFTLDADSVLHTVRASDGNPATRGMHTNLASLPSGQLWACKAGMGSEMHRVSPGQDAQRIAGLIRPFANHPDEAFPELLDSPTEIAFQPDGSLLVTDTTLNRLRQVLPNGTVQEFPGSPLIRQGVWCDASGRVVFGGSAFISLARFDPRDGTTTSLLKAGHDNEIADGSYEWAQGGLVKYLVGDRSGNIYFLDTISEGDSSIAQLYVRKLSADGSIITLAGGRYGYTDGPGASARFAYFGGIALDNAGNVLVVDTGNHAVRKVSPDGVVSTVAGGSRAGYQDGSVAQAQFKSPIGVAVDRSCNIFVTDTENACLRVITPEGNVRTLIGNPAQPGTRVGPVETASLYRPQCIKVNADGDLILADSGMVLQFTNPMTH